MQTAERRRQRGDERKSHGRSLWGRRRRNWARSCPPRWVSNTIVLAHQKSYFVTVEHQGEAEEGLGRKPNIQKGRSYALFPVSFPSKKGWFMRVDKALRRGFEYVYFDRGQFTLCRYETFTHSLPPSPTLCLLVKPRTRNHRATLPAALSVWTNMKRMKNKRPTHPDLINPAIRL